MNKEKKYYGEYDEQQMQNKGAELILRKGNKEERIMLRGLNDGD